MYICFNFNGKMKKKGSQISKKKNASWLICFVW